LVGAETVRVEVPVGVTVRGVRLVVRLEGAVITSPTFALKPWMLVTVMVDVQGDPPATTARKNGSAEMSKSGAFTFTKIVVEAWRLPLMPVTSMKYD
jgi:hypothetical protein